MKCKIFRSQDLSVNGRFRYLILMLLSTVAILSLGGICSALNFQCYRLHLIMLCILYIAVHVIAIISIHKTSVRNKHFLNRFTQALSCVGAIYFAVVCIKLVNGTMVADVSGGYIGFESVVALLLGLHVLMSTIFLFSKQDSVRKTMAYVYIGIIAAFVVLHGCFVTHVNLIYLVSFSSDTSLVSVNINPWIYGFVIGVVELIILFAPALIVMRHRNYVSLRDSNDAYDVMSLISIWHAVSFAVFITVSAVCVSIFLMSVA